MGSPSGYTSERSGAGAGRPSSLGGAVNGRSDEDQLTERLLSSLIGQIMARIQQPIHGEASPSTADKRLCQWDIHVACLEPLQALGHGHRCDAALGSEVILVDHIQRHVHELGGVCPQVQLLRRIGRTGHPGATSHGIGQQQSEQPVEVIVHIMGHNFFVLAVLDEKAIAKLAFLLGGGELELQCFHPRDVVHAEHPLLHLPGHPGNRGVSRVDLRGEPSISVYLIISKLK